MQNHNQVASTSSSQYTTVTISHDSSPQRILLSTSSLTKTFITIVTFFALCHAVTIYLAYIGFTEGNIAKGIFKLFNLNSEKGFANYFSGFILLTAAALLYFIYRNVHTSAHHKPKKPWLVLSIVFLFLCMDELLSWHEKLIPITQEFLGTTVNGFLLWAWVVPYALLVVGVTVYFWKFVMGLPTATRNLFFLSAFIYVSGALGTEMLQGYAYERNYYFFNEVLILLQEVMEMAGIGLFIYALLKYISMHSRELTIAFK